MQKPQLVAVDTNVLMRLACGDDDVTDAWLLIQRRLHPVQLIVPPTVLGELASKAFEDPEPAVRSAARKAMLEMRSRWQMLPSDFNALQEALAENATRQLRESGLLPYEERNDAAVIAESAVVNCILLVSEDSHLLQVDHARLSLVLSRLDLPTPVISSPKELLRRFFT